MLHKLTQTDGADMWIDDRQVFTVWGETDNVKVQTGQRIEGPFRGTVLGVVHELNKRRSAIVEVAQ